MRVFFYIILYLISKSVWSYPNYIGHGYTSCLNCHYNPFGGGQLNDYGRAVSATAISSRAFYPKNWSDEKIADSSGFLLRKPKQNWFRPQANYRGFNLVTNPGSGSSEEKEWITMQMDVRAAVKFGENDKLIIFGDYGKLPPQQETIEGMTGKQKYRSRNHVIGYKVNKKVGVYAGFMDKVYGLRVIEHIAYSRELPRISQIDQVHGVAGHFLLGEWEGGVHGFVGDLNQKTDFRMKGASTQWERTLFSSHRIGGSFLKSNNDYISLMSYAAHGRFNFKEGSALLVELGQTQKSHQQNIADATARYGLLQTYVRPYRGFYVFSNIEYLKNDISKSDYSIRVGPGIQYFPIQRIELRADFYNTRNFGPSTATRDAWMYLLQTHIWL